MGKGEIRMSGCKHTSGVPPLVNTSQRYLIFSSSFAILNLLFTKPELRVDDEVASAWTRLCRIVLSLLSQAEQVSKRVAVAMNQLGL
jgi:hypothetical protein